MLREQTKPAKFALFVPSAAFALKIPDLENVISPCHYNSQYGLASALPWHRPPGQVCEAISLLKQGIASTEKHRLAMTRTNDAFFWYNLNP
jgi:hypothetical protein